MKCPHGIKVVERIKLGITVYVHDNKKKDPCKLLNTGNLSLERMNDFVLKANKPDIRSKYVKATMTNKTTIDYVVEWVATEKDVDNVLSVLQEFRAENLLTEKNINALYGRFGKYARVLFDKAGVLDHVGYYYWAQNYDNAMYKEKPNCLENAVLTEDEKTVIGNEPNIAPDDFDRVYVAMEEDMALALKDLEALQEAIELAKKNLDNIGEETCTWADTNCRPVAIPEAHDPGDSAVLFQQCPDLVEVDEKGFKYKRVGVEAKDGKVKYYNPDFNIKWCNGVTGKYPPCIFNDQRSNAPCNSGSRDGCVQVSYRRSVRDYYKPKEG